MRQVSASQEQEQRNLQAAQEREDRVIAIWQRGPMTLAAARVIDQRRQKGRT